jgi:transcriptional regulator with XRE-family HTH domain
MNTPLKICRAKEGLNLRALASKCNTSKSTMSRLESGRAKSPSGNVCLKLIKRYEGYGLTLDHLINPDKYPDFVITKLHRK